MIGDVDRSYWRRDYLVVGVDEVGRGPLAGPVTAGAVVLNHLNLPDQIDDSKKLRRSKREGLSWLIRHQCLGWSVKSVAVAKINEVGIKAATLLAMRLAVEDVYDRLRSMFTDGVRVVVLVDGLDVIPEISLRQKAIVRGDSLSLSVAAASIVAKVDRDAFMNVLSLKYPKYLFDKNSGYGTADHVRALRRHGPCPQHRRQFIQKIMKGESTHGS